MRYFIVISLVFSFCFLSMRSALVFSYFKWNQAYITANFCVDRNVVQSSCKGTCQLKDLMIANEENDQPQSLPIIPNLQVEEFYLSTISDLALSSDTRPLYPANFTYFSIKDRLSSKRIFHPPEHFLFFV